LHQSRRSTLLTIDDVKKFDVFGLEGIAIHFL
jgi:hypothetical protein